MASFTPIDEAAFLKGGAQAKDTGPRVASAHFDRATHRIVLRLDSGIDLSFDPRHAHGLERAGAAELDGVEVIGIGNAIHFPKLDAFFSVPRILEGFLGPMDWTRREARAEASRQNGKLGGRPKRTPAHA